MKIALIGFPQAGKRTFFTLVTGRALPQGMSESESLEGTGHVQDARAARIAEIVRPRTVRHPELTLVLCPDVRQGDSKRVWLEYARKCDLVCGVLRMFESDSVYHVLGSVDAERDRASLDTELMLADLELVETRLERLKKEKRGGRTPVQVVEEKTLLKCKEGIESEKRLRELEFEPGQIDSIKSLGFLTLLPAVWLYNTGEGQSFSENCSNGVAVSCQLEKEITAMEDAGERAEYRKELGMLESGMEKVNQAARDAMNLVTFYTFAGDEVGAWTVAEGTHAPQAAGKVHSDMERGFIRVEVIRYGDFIEAGGETAAREQGKAHLKGKDYIVEDGDICLFRFSV